MVSTNTICANCRRKGHDVTVRQFSRQLLRHKHNRPYYALPKLTRHEAQIRRQYGQDAVKVFLCGCCERHLLEGSNDANDYWPSMIYNFLSHGTPDNILVVPFQDRWALIPGTWRRWWHEEFAHEILHHNEHAVFLDVTNELADLEKAVDDLKWLPLARCMDRHFAYPEVRCPWGCSEFLHRTQRLKLKDFLWYYSNYQMKCFQAPTGRHWTDSISPSYPSPCMILEKFMCSPSIAITDDGPVVLCCREHSEASKLAYLHVPESPTGTIFTPNANSFAPVAIRSRTNRNYKANVFSDTFCSMKQVGGFGGIDSSYITSSNIAGRCDSLSNRRDALAIQGRSDIRAQVYDRCSDKASSCFMPETKVEQILSLSEKKYPNPTTLPEYKTSTYITCETAVRLQEIMFEDASTTIKVYSDDGGTQGSQKLFIPPWPTYFVHVHPVDGYGRRFQRVMNADCGLWMFLCLTGMVTDVWEAIAGSVKDNRSWQGYWLLFASHNLGLPGKKASSRFFPMVEDIGDLFDAPLEEILGDQQATEDLFFGCDQIQVTEGSLTESELDLSNKTVVICIDPVWSDHDDNTDGSFELRCLLSVGRGDGGTTVKRDKWRMYVRHRGQKFWFQDGCNHPCKYNGSVLSGEAWDDARVAVYCRVHGSDHVALQRRYLNVIGGQSYAYCADHRRPLVLNHRNRCDNDDIHKCMCDSYQNPGTLCGRFGSYLCADHCGIAICDRHLRETKIKCVNSGPETVLYLSKDGSQMRQRCIHDSGAIRGEADVAMDDVPPEALGPTAAHEIPQDIVDLVNQGEAIDDESEDSWCYEVASGTSNDDLDSSLRDDDSSHLEGGGFGEPDHGEILPDFEQDEEDDESDSSNNAYLQTDPGILDATGIPTTNVGVEQREISVEHYDANGIKIPLCVLLNQQGHLLTRTNHKIRMNRRYRSVCERIVSKNTSKVVPLVYAEAQLFPTTFWYNLEDGSVPGAIPTALWADKTTLSKLGVAAMRQHAKMRISNPAIPTSVDPAYHFMLLDQLSNLGACGKHTRLVLQRGFADHQHEDGVSFRDKSDSAEIYGETNENHANVHKLSALVRERRPHYFFTQTSNQKTCKGLRVLREWITSTEALLLLQKKYGLTFAEAKYYLGESAASFVSRSWNEVADMWMRYIIYSPEQPLGPIDYAWYRKEFQDTEGNLAHIHAIIRTLYDVDNPEELQMVLNKIRGCILELIHHHEYIQLQQAGIVSSVDHLLEIFKQAKSYLTHRCHSRCQIPVTTSDGEIFYVCKSKENYFRTLTPHIHSIEPVEVRHHPEAIKIYNHLGMMDGTRIIEPCLVSEYHVPICSREDPKFSPTNGILFALMPSSQNLQFTTGRMLADYLVKYVTSLDKVARAEMKPPRHFDTVHARAIVEQLHNTKITSNQIIAEKTRKKGANYGRIVNHTECLSVVLGEEIVKSTVPFVYFSTSPREYRQATFKQAYFKNASNVPDYITFLASVQQEIRLQRFASPTDACRRFSRDQMTVIFDERSSSLSVDAITVFSIRPPELRFVNSVPLYFRWFERRGMKRSQKTLKAELELRLKKDLTKSAWIDGLHMQIVLRRGAITEIKDYITDTDPELFGGASKKRTMMTLFNLIERHLQQFGQHEMDPDENLPRTRQTTVNTSRQQYEYICDYFLSDDSSTTLPTPWTTPVFPKNRGRFLIHILLLLGRFETEYGLMNCDTMREAYIHAGLFDPGEQESSFDNLLARYIRECLSAQSGSVQHHDRNLILANAAFGECLLGTEDGLVIGTPCVLQSAMKEETTEKINAEKNKLIRSFVAALYADLENSGFDSATLPNRTQLEALHCKPTPLRHDGIDLGNVGVVNYTFPPQYNSNGVQSLQSYTEQERVLITAKNTIDRFLHGRSHKNLVICGGPGNGKTTVCEEVCLYAFSRGLRGISTSIVADRSKALGGMHIHLLCAIPMSDRRNMSPGRAAESALSCIYRKPELLHFWRELQFLYIDECGAVSAEMLATMDIIARKLKDSSRFLGGILVIASMDVYQLLPIDGTALMLSMNMMCEFHFAELTESVRAARDANLRRLCALTRTSEWDDAKRNEFGHIITTYCNFVDTFDDPRLPKDGIFVFGRKAPCQRIEEILIQRMKNDPTVSLVLSKAEDEESSIVGNWRTASAPVSQELSRKLKRKLDLYLFKNGRYEFTYNSHGHFQQGQLAILLDIDQCDVDNRKKIEFFKGPPGCKEFPSLDNFTEEYLESHGWERVMVPFETSKSHRVWGNIVGRRSQYGVRLRIASTIHASQGATFGKLVTAVSTLQSHGDLNFTLWDAAQVVVLLSRTRMCSDIYFVGQKSDIVEKLLEVLEAKTRYMAHITSMTHRLCCRSDDTPALTGPPIFRPCDIILDPIPAVYLLVSTRFYGYMYIGQTDDIRKRITEHNSGRGTDFTNNEQLRPWAIFGYVSGFIRGDNKRNFEQFWKRRVYSQNNSHQTRSPTAVLDVARNIATQKNRTRRVAHQLRVMQCGSYQVRQDRTFRVVD